MARKVGDVYAIKLPDNTYKFGRILEDEGIQVFAKAAKSPIFDQSILDTVDFTVAMMRRAFKDPRLIKVGHAAFTSEEEAWPPKTYLFDPLNDKYSIYYKGQIYPSTKEDCAGLEPTAGWELDHIIDRITGRVDWLKVSSDEVLKSHMKKPQ